MPTVEKIGDNVFVRGVAVFDEHDDPSRPGSLRRVDANVLGQFVENTNRRLVSEYELPLAAGWHTPKPGESHVPPPIKGGYRNLRLDDFTDANGTRKAVYADLRIPVGEWDGVSSLQRRSIEAFPDTKEFDTLVLLGSKAPARDLGRLTPVAHYSRDGREVIRYEMATEDAPESTEPPQETSSMFSPEDKAELMSMMQEAFKAVLAEEMNPDEAEPDADADGIPNALDADADGDGVPNEEEATGMAVQEPEQYERLRMEDEQRKVVQYERRMKEAEAKIAKLTSERDSEHYTRRLSELVDKGVLLDRADELKEIMGMKSEADRNKHLERIEKSYSKDPTFESSAGRQAVQYERQTPTEGGGLPDSISQRIQKLAGEMGNWDAAKAAVLNGKA